METSTIQGQRILLTGASGNLGQYALKHLMAKARNEDCFRLMLRNSKRGKQLKGSLLAMDKRVEVVCFDLLDSAAWVEALEDIDVVVHLAAIIPPQTDKIPQKAYKANVQSVRAMCEAIATIDENATPPHVVFTSSVVVYGSAKPDGTPHCVDDEQQAIDLYGEHKIASEAYIRDLPSWTILRIGAAPAIELAAFDPIVFEIGLDNQVEFVHPSDAGLAIANATLQAHNLHGSVFNIGGGAQCQMNYHDFFTQSLNATGVGMLPERAFSQKRFSTSWMDTTASQQVLNYQEHTLQDWLLGMRREMGWMYPIVRMLGPIIRWFLARQSPYLNRS